MLRGAAFSSILVGSLGTALLLGFGCSGGDTGSSGSPSGGGGSTGSGAGSPSSSGSNSGGAGGTGGGSSGVHLVPGTGFKGPTAEPGPVGDASDTAHAATAIARWDVVPFQDVSGQLAVGVVAFDIRGIDRVELSVEGGPFAPVTKMTKNAATGVWEYWAVIDAADFTKEQEGPIEVRAIAYPNVGIPRVLADGASMQDDSGDGSLHLYVDEGKLGHAKRWVAADGDDATGDGTEARPFATIGGAIEALADGGGSSGATIYLGEGDYVTPDTEANGDDRWITITRAANASKDHVKIVDRAGRWNTKHVRLHDLSIVPVAAAGGTIALPSIDGGAIWFDGVDIDGGDREVATGPLVNQADTYWTDVTIREYANPVDTWNGLNVLVRSTHAQGVLEDAFRVATLLVNVSVDDVDPRDSGAHPDIIQYGAGGNASNFLVYGLEATHANSQGIYISGFGWALVNIAIDAPGGALWQVDEAVADHVLLWHVTTVAQPFLWRTGNQTSACANISIRNSTFESMSIGPSSKGNDTDADVLVSKMDIADNNFADGNTLGKHATGVDPGLADPAGGDFHPKHGSPLVGRVTELITPADLEGTALATDGSAAIGALQQAH